MYKVFNDRDATQCIGRVESDGKIYNHEFEGRCIGSVEPTSKVYNFDNSGRYAGRVAQDGQIYNDISSTTCIAHVDTDGLIYVYEMDRPDTCVGRVTPPNVNAGGGALLLLLRPQAPERAIRQIPVPQVTAVVDARTYCPQCDMDRGSVIQCPVCSTRLIEYGRTPSIKRAQDSLPASPGMLACRECGFANIPDRRICQNCRAPLYASSEYSQTLPASSTPMASSPNASASPSLSLDERRVLLDREVERYVTAGYILISRTENTAQLVSESSPNGCLLIGLFLLGVVPGVIYMMIAKKTTSLYIELDQFGRLKHTSVTK